MTYLSKLIEKYPRAAKACEVNKTTHRETLAQLVRVKARSLGVGDDFFDSVESLMAAIESHIASQEPKPITEEDVAEMRWTDSGRYQSSEGCVYGSKISGGFFVCACISSRDDALAAHNANIDRLWDECKRLAAEVEWMASDLEAKR